MCEFDWIAFWVWGSITFAIGWATRALIPRDNDKE